MPPLFRAAALLSGVPAGAKAPTRRSHRSQMMSDSLKARQWAQAVSLLREMRFLGQVRQRGLAPEVSTYHAVIGACVSAQQWATSVELFDEMVQDGLEADAISHAVAIGACRKLQDWAHARSLLASLQRQGLPTTLGQIGRRRRPVAYGTAAGVALTRLHLWREAIAVFDRVEGSRLALDVVACNVMITACHRGRRVAEALELQGKLQSVGRGGGIGPRADLVTYNAALAACDEWEEVLRLLAGVRGRRLSPDTVTLNSAISACSRGHAWGLGLELYRAMADGGCVAPDMVTYNAAIHASERVGGAASAREIAAEMQRAGLSPDMFTFSTMISACERAARWTEALTTLEEMQLAGLGSNIAAYNAAMSACRSGEEWERALRLFAEMRAGKLRANVVSYTAAISACETGHHRNQALALLREMHWTGPDPEVRNYNSAIGACAAGSDWQRALALVGELKARWLEPDIVTVNSMISACENAGRWQLALAVLADAPSAGLRPNTITFSSTVSALEKGAQWEHALQVLGEMRSGRLAPDAITYSAAISAFCGAGLAALARDMYDEARGQGFLLPLQGQGKGGVTVLDLHGLPVSIAELAVQAAFEGRSALPLGRAGAGGQVAVVITGRGQHSPDGEARIRRAVLGMLASHPSLCARVDPTNPGCLLVGMRPAVEHEPGSAVEPAGS